MQSERSRGNLIERNDWKVWLVLCLLLAWVGFENIRLGASAYGDETAVQFAQVTGTTWDALSASDPGAARLIDDQLRLEGASQLGGSAAFLLIAVFGLRRRERWAWLAMWILPLTLGLQAAIGLLTEKAPGASSGVSGIIGQLVFLGLMAALLVLTFRRYVPGRQ
jgi:hypothetical protein